MPLPDTTGGGFLSPTDELEKAVNHRWTYAAVAKTRAQADKYGLFKKANQKPGSFVRLNFGMKHLPDFAVHLCLSAAPTAVFRMNGHG